MTSSRTSMWPAEKLIFGAAAVGQSQAVYEHKLSDMMPSTASIYPLPKLCVSVAFLLRHDGSGIYWLKIAEARHNLLQFSPTMVEALNRALDVRGQSSQMSFGEYVRTFFLGHPTVWAVVSERGANGQYAKTIADIAFTLFELARYSGEEHRTEITQVFEKDMPSD